VNFVVQTGPGVHYFLARSLTVTVSVGAATTIGVADMDGLYARADGALYAAKSDGPGLLRVAT